VEMLSLQDSEVFSSVNPGDDGNLTMDEEARLTSMYSENWNRIDRYTRAHGLKKKMKS